MVMSEGAMWKAKSRVRPPTRAIIAMLVFALGALGGAGAASWFMPY